MNRHRLNTVGMAFLLPATKGRGEQTHALALVERLQQLAPETFSYEGKALDSWQRIVEAAVQGKQQAEEAEAIGALIAAGCVVLDYEVNVHSYHVMHGLPQG
jgi:hypothetical protein